MLGRKKRVKRLKKLLRECWSTIGSKFAKPRREAFRSLSDLRSKKTTKKNNKPLDHFSMINFRAPVKHPALHKHLKVL